MSNQPTHRVYMVKDLEDGDKSHWTTIGAAWAHKDGDGLNIQLDAMPLNGRLVIRKATARQESQD